MHAYDHAIPDAFAPAHDAAWHALTVDAAAFVFLLDADAVVRATNHAARELCRPLVGEPVGRDLAAIFGRPFAIERAELLARVRNGEPRVRLRGMICGVLCTETYRALLPAADVLLVARPCGLDADLPELAHEPTPPLAQTNHLARLSALTERELELLHHLGLGRTSEEIATLMHRSTRTVEWHRASLGRKLDCDNRVQLARLAARAGITTLDPSLIRALHRSNTHPHGTR